MKKREVLANTIDAAQRRQNSPFPQNLNKPRQRNAGETEVRNRGTGYSPPAPYILVEASGLIRQKQAGLRAE